MATFGILVGGGPAPGINGVIGAAALLARRRGHRVLGILDGFSHLMEGRTDRVRELRPRGRRDDPPAGRLDPAHLAREPDEEARAPRGGGEVAERARRRPPDHDRRRRHGLLRQARRRAPPAARITVVHVPKTIDNDLPLPDGIPTFGFETAREHVGAASSRRCMEDARTAGRWYFLVLMGRKAGLPGARRGEGGRRDARR